MGNSTKRLFLSLAMLLTVFFQESHQGKHERRLLDTLFVDRAHNVLERPVANEKDVLNVTFSLTLQQILDVDEKNQIIHTNIWLDMTWTDYTFIWNEAEFGNISAIRIPAGKLWKPDVLLYNSASEAFDGTYHTNVVIYSSGYMNWIPPGMFGSSCHIDITWFPFDMQFCKLKFGTWSYDGSQVDLVLKSEKGDISSFIKNGEWDLLGVTAKRNEIYYDCCPDTPYVDVTYTINIKRRTLYYGFNLIIPCVLLSLLAILTFMLPPDAGEKVSLAVTIMLSLTVFLMIVADVLPPTSDAVPLIVIYFGMILALCSMSVVFSVLVLSYHHRADDTHDMPSWVKYGICEWLAWILFVSRPGKDLSRKAILQRQKLRKMEEKQRNSPSLLANVAEVDDYHRNGLMGVKVDRDTRSKEHFSSDSHACSTRNELRNIYKELKVITDKMKDDDSSSVVSSDWKFAAHVIDRLCLITFSAAIVICTLVVLASTPHGIM
ncbi:neuronal acetylcholine receptor subunit alpha-7 isoform X1 [Lingula anatina]|uniref:Neuronal acetylcholine receptor subunit alpha-7 isoform X1 n=1 Tax=Lingula anatina TaxID=7574 RepID=A0A1S3J9C7_LINAN|nr:neuronal acetylcholine receptor subunit alpha-7 isoform X1 [Lingula anatina]|eukprot:XP_013406821.1 neuronal acetylcholine receptor subunit alpha-7 isoform X1 [Lingula anatina]